ncbi:MAG: hypothetical protein K2N72_05540 [Oscillospiraceae bacterium]|nr:hypothetical protein [Oscillospiraceae bacterium]
MNLKIKLKITWKILRNVIIWVFVFIILVGVLFLQLATADLPARLKGVTDFNKMTAADFVPGRFVKGTVYSLVDEFAYEEVKVRNAMGSDTYVGDHYYILPLQTASENDIPQFAVLCIGDKKLAGQAEKVMSEYQDYLISGEMSDDPATFHITGKISNLGGEVGEYFREWFYDLYGDDSADIGSMICPYVITYEPENYHIKELLISLAAFAAGIAGCVWVVRWHINYEKELQAEREAQSDEAT